MSAFLAYNASQKADAPAPSPMLKFARDVVAGTCGGVVVTLVGHPFDTLKVRLQTQPADKPIYSGVVDCAKKTVQWEGFGGLYKGVASPLAGQMFFRASMFSAYGYTKRWLITDSNGVARPITLKDGYLAGAITGAVASLTESPIDFFKSQMQVQIIRARMDSSYNPPFTTVFGAVRAAFAANGMLAPFQGWSATFIRNVPANCVYLGSFEAAKNYEAARRGCTVPELPAPFVLTSAGIGGLLYWVTVYPIDVIKSAMMTDALAKTERRYPSFLATASSLMKEGGVKRFYKGFAPCLIRAMPANAAMLFTVDKVTEALSM
ncbi:unnamed protein product [Pedinophyceae sp. YPF-701]|nr:unnamed protein product [Pedinophyceae sp. YPF-701]